MSFGQWIGFIILIIALYVLWSIRQLVLLIFAAVILATALNFLVHNLQIWVRFVGFKLGKSWHLKRGYAVLLAMILFLAISAILVILIIPPFANQIEDLVRLLPKAINRLNSLLDGFEENLTPLLQEAVPSLQELLGKLQPLINEIVNSGWTVVFSGIGAVLNSLLLLVLTLMLLADPQPYRQGFLRLFPAFYRCRANEIITICELALQELIGRVLINILVVGLGCFLVLLFLGIPLALAQGILAGLLSFIPYIGSALSVLSPLLISLVDSSWKWWVVIVLYFLVYQIKINIILPKLGHQKILVLPGIMLLAQLFFATFFGFMGLLIALPLTVIGRILFQEIIIKDILNHWEITNN
jgi:predicted PurR-regulated permease PerM